MSPREAKQAARIESAKSFLRNSDHSVTRIAELLGYCDIYLFSRQFKRHTGQTPTEWKRGHCSF
jgi:AraC-like DNA-binding protein